MSLRPEALNFSISDVSSFLSVTWLLFRPCSCDREDSLPQLLLVDHNFKFFGLSPLILLCPQLELWFVVESCSFVGLELTRVESLEVVGHLKGLVRGFL
jgi:hypothetical protein